jgi:NitT/TauT family transport system substrate-binding protein
MIFYDPAYYQNPVAIKHVEWGQDRVNFQSWPYRSATEQVVSELKDTLVTGETGFLADLSPEFVANDLVQYDYIKSTLEQYPAWRNDPSVPQTGDPYTRTEVIQL